MPEPSEWPSPTSPAPVSPAPQAAAPISEAEEGQQAAFVPDWSEDTKDMGSEFARALDGEYTEAAQEQARSAHAAADARWDIPPSYMQLAPGEAPPPDTHQAGMAAMKAREFEQVRFRSVPTTPGDLHLEATTALMRNDILDYIRAPGGPGSARNPDMGIKRIMDPATGLDPSDFIPRAHQRSLGVRRLRDDSASRVDYINPPALLSDFPAIAVGTVGDQLDTEEGCAKAIVQLVTKHAGEVVDFDSNRPQVGSRRCQL